jgi:hypothetical protein
MDRQEYKIKQLTEEVLKLKNQLREHENETYHTEGYGGTD